MQMDLYILYIRYKRGKIELSTPLFGKCACMKVLNVIVICKLKLS